MTIKISVGFQIPSPFTSSSENVVGEEVSPPLLPHLFNFQLVLLFYVYFKNFLFVFSSHPSDTDLYYPILLP